MLDGEHEHACERVYGRAVLTCSLDADTLVLAGSTGKRIEGRDPSVKPVILAVHAVRHVDLVQPKEGKEMLLEVQTMWKPTRRRGGEYGKRNAGRRVVL